MVAGVPLPRDFDFALGALVGEVADVFEQRLLRLVEMADEVDDAAVERATHDAIWRPRGGAWMAVQQHPDPGGCLTTV